MTQEYGRFMVSLFLLIILHNWNVSKNFLLSWRFLSNMNGGFPLSAPLVLWAMILMLEAAAAASPAATVTVRSPCLSVVCVLGFPREVVPE